VAFLARSALFGVIAVIFGIVFIVVLVVIAAVGLAMGIDAVQHSAHQGSMDLAEELMGHAGGALVSGIMSGYQQNPVSKNGNEQALGKTQDRGGIDDNMVKSIPELRQKLLEFFGIQ